MSLKEIFFFDVPSLSLLSITTLAKHNEFTITIPTKNSLKVALLLYKNIKMSSVLALELYSTTCDSSQNLYYNFLAPFSDLRINIVCFNLLHSLRSHSLSNFWLNLVWAERECSELSRMYFSGLKDTRRLLLDYFVEKEENNNRKKYYVGFDEIFSDYCVYI